MWSLRCMQESKMRIHLVRLVKIWAEQEEQDFICILMYVNSILRKERGEKNTSMHLEQCSECGNWETCVRSETGLWGLVSIQKQGSKNPNWLSFLVFCFFFFVLALFPKCQILKLATEGHNSNASSFVCKGTVLVF